MDPALLCDLREALTDVNQRHRNEQENAMEDLSVQFDHSCELVELGPEDVEDDYPAFAHCFDLQKHPIILENKERIFSNYGFRNPEKHKWEWNWGSFYGVAYHFMEKVDKDNIENGDVVFYLAEPTDDIKQMVVIHAGKVIDGKIVSKWGRGKEGSSTNVWSHDIEHVPDSYEDKDGNITIVYFRPNLEEIAAYFLRSYKTWHAPKVF